MYSLHELQTELRAAVSEVRWLARVLNAADRVAGLAGEVSYGEPGDATPDPPAADPTPRGASGVVGPATF